MTADRANEPFVVRRLRLRHPDLAFHVEVTLTEKDGRWLAVAMLAEEPYIGTGSDPRQALRDAVKGLGEPIAWDLADSAKLDL